MASIISYVGRIRYCREDDKPTKPSSQYGWDGNMDFASNLRKQNNLSTETFFLFEQALGLAYYLKFYGNRCSEIVNEYIDEVVYYINSNYATRAKREFQGTAYVRIVKAIEDLATYIKGGRWTDLPIKLITEFIEDVYCVKSDVPVVFDCPGEYVPFIIWMNNAAQVDYEQWSSENKVYLLSFDIRKDYKSSTNFALRTTRHSIGQSFASAKTDIDRGFPNLATFGFLSHCDLTSFSFENIVGILGEFCFHTDIERPGLSMSHILAYYISLGVTRSLVFTGDRHGFTADENPAISRHILFSATKTFMEYCFREFGCNPTEINVIRKLFWILASSQKEKDAVSYLKKEGATASSDELQSYKETFGKATEALELISQNPALLSAQSQVTAAEGTDAGKGDDKDAGSKGATASDDGADEPEEEPDEDTEEEDDDTSSSDGSDEDGQNGAPDDTPSEDEDNNEDPNQDGEEGGSGDPDDSGAVSDMPVKDESAPNLSDKKGIVIEFANAESETTDTVTFREEVNTLITDVLANPPKSMSPQNITTLSNLKRYWLHVVKIETVVGILESCLKIPLTSKKLKRTELSEK